ncbi:hypothetical protein DFH06DRAFT_1396789 [Mycena polygramma]|nr:hypothetical protein DFH06DRAFT_1396789 [Mycena polygramma]
MNWVVTFFIPAISPPRILDLRLHSNVGRGRLLTVWKTYSRRRGLRNSGMSRRNATQDGKAVAGKFNNDSKPAFTLPRDPTRVQWNLCQNAGLRLNRNTSLSRLVLPAQNSQSEKTASGQRARFDAAPGVERDHAPVQPPGGNVSSSSNERFYNASTEKESVSVGDLGNNLAWSWRQVESRKGVALSRISPQVPLEWMGKDKEKTGCLLHTAFRTPLSGLQLSIRYSDVRVAFEAFFSVKPIIDFAETGGTLRSVLVDMLRSQIPKACNSFDQKCVDTRNRTSICLSPRPWDMHEAALSFCTISSSEKANFTVFNFSLLHNLRAARKYLHTVQRAFSKSNWNICGFGHMQCLWVQEVDFADAESLMHSNKVSSTAQQLGAVDRTVFVFPSLNSY